MALKDKLSKNVKRLREQAGLSQWALAKKAKLNSGYIARLESNPQNVALDTLERLAKALDCSIGELIGIKEVVAVNSAESLALLDQGLELIQEFRGRVQGSEGSGSRIPPLPKPVSSEGPPKRRT